MRIHPFWILFLLIILPLGIAFLIFQGEPQYEKLPIHGFAEVDDSGDTVYHTIPQFELTNQLGETFTSDDTEGYMYVAKFIFTRCPTECPVMTSNMKRVHDFFIDLDELKFLSFTIDPRHDTAEVLYQYAEKYDIDHSRWHFLTGERDVIHELARNGYFITVKEGDDKAQQYLHSELFILIDKDNRIRGIYNGMNENEVMKLQDEILVLKHEYK